jgi:hypothetical protein
LEQATPPAVHAPGAASRQRVLGDDREIGTRDQDQDHGKRQERTVR